MVRVVQLALNENEWKSYSDVDSQLLWEDMVDTGFRGVCKASENLYGLYVKVTLDTDEQWDGMDDNEVVDEMLEGAESGLDFISLEKLNF